MAANDFVYASVPLPGDLGCKNTDIIQINAGDVVKLDAANPISAAQPISGVLQGTGAATPIYGVAMENIPVGKTGRIRPHGIAQCVASAAIAVGVEVTSAAAGQVATAGAAARQLGIALTAAAAINDKILVDIRVAKNA